MKNPLAYQNDVLSSEQKNQEDSIIKMNGMFRTLRAAQNSPPDNRQFANNFIALHLIKLQFSLRNFKMCKSAFERIDETEKEVIDMLPKAWHVGVAYYRGRFALYENDFNFAGQQLNSAYELCNSDSIINKQSILRFLVPAGMTVGKCPTMKLIETY